MFTVSSNMADGLNLNKILPFMHSVIGWGGLDVTIFALGKRIDLTANIEYTLKMKF